MLERFLASVNTPGSHILICLGLLIFYSVFTGASKSETAHDVIVFALAVLSRSMGSGNRPESLPPNTTTTATTSTVTAPEEVSTTTLATAPKEEKL